MYNYIVRGLRIEVIIKAHAVEEPQAFIRSWSVGVGCVPKEATLQPLSQSKILIIKCI